MRSILLLGLAVAHAVACSDKSSSSGTTLPADASTTSPAAARCVESCKKTLGNCQAPADQQEQECTRHCSGSLTETQLSCLASKTCTEIVTRSADELCPKSDGG